MDSSGNPVASDYGPSMSVPEVIQTERLQLRRAVSTDAETIFSSYGQDPEVSKYLTWRPATSVDQTRSFLVECERLWVEGRSFAWAITLTASDRLVGMIEARINEEGMELGYVVARQFWSQGIATEATRAVIDWALDDSSVTRIWAYTDVENMASARVLEKAGMTNEGLRDRYGNHPNVAPEPRDCWIYAVSRQRAPRP